MPKKQYNFEKINMKSYKIKCDSEILYRIYKNEHEFVDHPSSSISEALTSYNIETPFKIEVLMPKKRKYFEENELEEIKTEKPASSSNSETESQN
jgi:hypothetical protein